MPATQKNRFIAFKSPTGADNLLVRNFSMSEELGRLFQIELELESEDTNVDFSSLVGAKASVRLNLPDQDPRHFHGVISRFAQTQEQGGSARYRATLVPWLWLLTRASDCRIFQNKKVPDIIEEVFRGHGFGDYKLELTASYTEWEYCVQYRESDFNFVSRLMEQEGIYYYFKHEEDAHTLVLVDSKDSHQPFEGYDSIPYRPLRHQKNERDECVTDWVVEKQIQPGACVLSDFNFKTPTTDLKATDQISRPHEFSQFEVYDYPGEYEERGDGDTYAKLRIQELQAQHEILRGQATARGISVGSKFSLESHPRDDQNRDYLVTGISIQAAVGEYAAGAPADSGESFSCSFVAMPLSEDFRLARITTKPLIQGPQTAKVVGPSGEEICTDEYGRVKVKFHWDRAPAQDDTASCWVRVSQLWAGKGWGAINLPRVGHEVIIEFLEGDPDRPIITGRVYNAQNTVPYALPDQMTRTTFKTDSTKGGDGCNEFRLEDKKGSEQIFLYGEKDEDVRIKNDSKEWVGNNRHLIVKKDQMEKVEGDKHSSVTGKQLSKITGNQGEIVKGDHLVSIDGKDHLTVKGDQAMKVDGDVSLKIGKNLNQEAGAKISIKSTQDFHGKAGQNYAMEAGMAIHIKGGTTVVIEGGTQLSLKAGPSFVDIGPSGVAISGPMVMINSGGSAGSGAGSSPTAPAAPDAPDEPTDPMEAADQGS